MTPPKLPDPAAKPVRSADLPLSASVGYQIRMAHRAMQRLLQLRIEPHGITLGMWYFLRALWHEDGLTQRELSRRTGTTEPTALIAIQSMEKRGLVRRTRGSKDRRKWHIHLTAKAGKLKATLIPLARDVIDTAVQGLTQPDVAKLVQLLAEIRNNVRATIIQIDDLGLVGEPAKRSRPVRKSR
jgi:DNA-binding MarR family transcriptional regulator